MAHITMPKGKGRPKPTPSYRSRRDRTLAEHRRFVFRQPLWCKPAMSTPKLGGFACKFLNAFSNVNLQRSEHQPMSNIRDEQRALRDQQRAAIKAAVAHANAIIQPVVSFPARTKVTEHRPCDVARIPARSDAC
jgi:hypothetical protein